MQVEVENIEKTYLDTQALMNVEKEKHFDTTAKERSLLEDRFSKERAELQTHIDDLKRENELLKDNYEKGKIRESDLKQEISNLLDSLNEKSNLEERVINIGLSNNYFKNVAEIFKKAIELWGISFKLITNITWTWYFLGKCHSFFLPLRLIFNLKKN